MESLPTQTIFKAGAVLLSVGVVCLVAAATVPRTPTGARTLAALGTVTFVLGALFWGYLHLRSELDAGLVDAEPRQP
ncbi:hypothetical protein VB773_00335 [Haloarculaceae archaeon H-GB2-1]|nr:hypothetical protein [Haloarculaceae archaeon H-GB1-1]MEA5388156.1 hypothetical protein [Haloarculaceae archaeon H-GB11]MEA5406177.1 hypothetical protein [Haloarculaceae archaeon H-GB2-1]